MSKTVTMEDKQYQDYLEYLTTAPNIQDVKKPNKKEFGEENKHPTLKPEKLMEWLVKLTTNEGDVVLDCFSGSGTTGCATVRLGRNYIGIEKSEEYCEASKKRINKVLGKGTQNGDLLGVDSSKEEMGSFVIINDECINAMKKLPANSVDAILCDPPYNIKMADWDAFKTNFEFSEWCEAWGREAYRVLRPGGIIASFSAARTYHFLAFGLEKAGFQCRDMVEWVFWSGMPKGKNLKGCHEPIYLGIKPDPKNGLANYTFNIDACRIPVVNKKNKDGSTKVSINNLDFNVERGTE